MDCHFATAALPVPTAIWITEPTKEGNHIGQLASSSVSPDAGTLQILGKASSVIISSKGPSEISTGSGYGSVISQVQICLQAIMSQSQSSQFLLLMTKKTSQVNNYFLLLDEMGRA